MRRLTDAELSLLKRISLYGYFSVESMSDAEIHAAQTPRRDYDALGGDLSSFCVNRNTLRIIQSEEERRQQDHERQESQSCCQQNLDGMNRLAKMNKKSKKKRELLISLIAVPIVAMLIEDAYSFLKELIAHLIKLLR